jgi:hypothetical protein
MQLMVMLILMREIKVTLSHYTAVPCSGSTLQTMNDFLLDYTIGQLALRTNTTSSPLRALSRKRDGQYAGCGIVKVALRHTRT